MEVKIETDGDTWTVQVGSDAPREFRDRVYALIYINNLTSAMVAEEE